MYAKKILLVITLATLTLALLRLSIQQVQATPSSTVTVCASNCDYPTIKTALIAVSDGATIQVTDNTHQENGIFINKQVKLKVLFNQKR